MPQSSTVPHFVLYEEATQDVELLSLHVEPIRSRSSKHHWTIRPHTHPDHHQILLLVSGGGTLSVEDEVRRLAPVVIVTVPALVVHAYRFDPGTDGFVVTVSLSFLDGLLSEDFRLGDGFAGRGRCFSPGPLAAAAIGSFRALQQEFLWSAPGRRSAIKAHLQLLLVTIARLHGRDQPPQDEVRRRDTETVARYRQHIERNFHQQPGLGDFARAIGVTTARLNTACRAVTGRSAMMLVHDRLVIEAKRDLLYTDRAVGEVARALGFADPAYFNRFFRRHTGQTPGAFRREMGTIMPGLPAA
jgi:AraC family transcriptional activator of pobA